VKVDTINKQLSQVVKQIKVNPSKLAAIVKKSNKNLDKFYSNSIFCDLVTMDHCKELLWVVQGINKFHYKATIEFKHLGMVLDVTEDQSNELLRKSTPGGIQS
jgi:hypothetical protein